MSKKKRIETTRKEKNQHQHFHRFLNTKTQTSPPASPLPPTETQKDTRDIFIRGHDIRAIDSESEHANVSLSWRDQGYREVTTFYPEIPVSPPPSFVRSRPVTSSSTPINPDYSPFAFVCHPYRANVA